MNRRGFLTQLLKAGVGAAILPSATTYARRWVRTASGVLIDSEYSCVMVKPQPGYILRSYVWSMHYPQIVIENFSDQEPAWKT